MEALAAVASGAGLVSLAIQLLESSQKLKGLYNASRNAPRTIEDLCFELETLSLQLRQLERHRRLDRLDTTEVLDRCIAVCEQRVIRVRDVVDAMSRYMQRGSMFGGVYTAFKEPEMRKLIVELEQAKSSLSLAYISYCQSWNMRDSAHQALALQQHRDLLALQQLQLANIQQTVAKGTSLLTSQLTNVSTVRDDTSCAQAPKKRRAGHRRMFLRLPQFLVDQTWTLAAYHSQGSWTLEIHPEFWRPFETPALDYIRTGDIANVMKALDTGQLSIWDSTWHPWNFRFPTSLLGLVVYHGQIRLCEYLLHNVEHFRSDDQLQQALRSLDIASFSTSLRAEILELFAGKYDMDVFIFGPSDYNSRHLKSVFYHLSKVIMSHQPVGLEKVPFETRFNIAMKLRGRSPADFLATVGLEINGQLLSMTDDIGSTLLHWAAMHWSIGHRREWPSARLKIYGDFVVNLIRAGSCVSAINKRGHSPFMCLLVSDDLPDFWWYETYQIPPVLHPSQLVNSWGMLLSRAGVSLPEYCERETLILSSLQPEHPIQWCWRGRELELKDISLGDQTTFTLEVNTTEYHTIWENRPMPGSFMDTVPDIRRLPWLPFSEGDPQTSWQLIKMQTLESSKSFQLSPDSIDDVEFDLGQILFWGTQDDHMMLAAVYRQEQQRISRVRDGILSKGRSSSTPPAAKTFVEYMTRIPDTHSPIGRPLYVHKCLQNFRWGFCRSEYGYAYDIRARCMAGCCQRTDHGAQIADAFLPSKKSLTAPRERWLVDNFPWKYESEGNLASGSHVG